MALFELIYNYFWGLLCPSGEIGSLDTYMNVTFSLFDESFVLFEYLALILTFISFIFIIVLCCLFVYKIVRLIGGLIR